MTLPLTLPLKLSDIVTEFSAPLATPFSEFVRDGAYVPSNLDNTAIPLVLPLKITDFFGASQTIPVLESVLPDTTYFLAGPISTSEHFYLSPTILTNEKYVIELKVRCDVDHVDGSDEPPELPGYSWQRQRMNMVIGMGDPGNPDIEFFGVEVRILFTSATSGYIAVYAYNASLITSEQVTSAGVYQEEPNTVYGNFVIPDGEDSIHIRLTRGEGITQAIVGGETGYALDYNLYVYTRQGDDVLWKQIEMRYIASGSSFISMLGHNNEGNLLIRNFEYTNGADCTLEILEVEGAVGVTELP